MPLPTTDAELKMLGYIQMDETRCRKCHAAIIFYRTPKGKLMPMDKHTLVSHFGTCPFADQFRRKKK